MGTELIVGRDDSRGGGLALSASEFCIAAMLLLNGGRDVDSEAG